MADRTIDEILNFVEENDVKFIRLAILRYLRKSEKHFHYAL